MTEPASKRPRVGQAVAADGGTGGRRHVAVIATGGTLDKAYPRLIKGWGFEIADPAADRVFERVVPRNFEYSVASVCKKDSQELTEADREAILEACAASEHEWIIITHGTDTMIETACVLGRAHGSRLGTKRICVTGAMKPERMVDTDAHFNLGVCLGALNLAAPGVYVCMNGLVHRWDAVVRDLETGLFAPKAP